MADNYNHLQGTLIDADAHPNNILPDVGPANKPTSAGDFSTLLKQRKGISDLSSQMNFYNALGSMYKGQ